MGVELRVDLHGHHRRLDVADDVALHRDGRLAIAPPDQPLLEVVADGGDLRQRDPAPALGRAR